MNKIKLWIALALITIVGVIVVQNTDPVETQVLWASVTMPRAMLLAVTFVSGFLAGYLLRMRDATK